VQFCMSLVVYGGSRRERGRAVVAIGVGGVHSVEISRDIVFAFFSSYSLLVMTCIGGVHIAHHQDLQVVPTLAADRPCLLAMLWYLLAVKEY